MMKCEHFHIQWLEDALKDNPDRLFHITTRPHSEDHGFVPIGSPTFPTLCGKPRGASVEEMRKHGDGYVGMASIRDIPSLYEDKNLCFNCMHVFARSQR